MTAHKTSLIFSKVHRETQVVSAALLCDCWTGTVNNHHELDEACSSEVHKNLSPWNIKIPQQIWEERFTIAEQCQCFTSYLLLVCNVST